jgi:catechol 2,3-dioxygenase-like lactoylglutathione lyase family enzyme
VFVKNAIHHIALSVTDMERATWFYSEVLGLETIPRPPFDFGGAWYQLGDRQLHLIVHPPTRTLRHSMEIGPREGHLALRVQSRRELIERLDKHGITYLDLPDNLTPWAQVYCCDPDGNLLEFNVERSDEA